MKENRFSRGLIVLLFVLAAPVGSPAASPGGEASPACLLAGPRGCELIVEAPDLSRRTNPGALALGCTLGQNASDASNDVSPAYADMLGMVTSLSGEQLTATFSLRDVPASLAFNRSSVPINSLEYAWVVQIDLNRDQTTDYRLSVLHFKFSNTGTTGSIPANTQTDVWKVEGNSATRLSSATLVVDTTANTLKLTGTIPGIASSALVDFYTVDYDGSNYVTDIAEACKNPPAGCVDDLSNGKVCLRSGRYEVTGTWTGFEDETKRPIIWTRETEEVALGVFQNNPNDVTVIAKMVWGCPFNDRYWFWLGGFTDAGWDIVVKDFQTGATKSFVRARQSGSFPVTQRETETFPCP